MKKSYLVHIFWLFIAIAAFAIGSKSSDSATDQELAEDGKGASARGSLSSRASGGGSGRSGGTRAASRNRSISGANELEGGDLSEAAIKQLGLDLKAAKTPLERRSVFMKILANLTPENAKLMREQITQLDSNSSEFRDFHYQWGAIAGEEAVLNGAETPERDMATTLAGWAATDPEAALAYFNGLDADTQNGGGMKWGAVYGLVDADPNLAVRFAMDRKEAGDDEANRIMDLVTRRVIKAGDPSEAASWATRLPVGEMKDTAIRRVAEEYANDDPVAAFDWANTLPEGKGKNQAMRKSFSEWARDDPKAAANRLSSLAASPERDSATYGYATRVAREDAATAIEWANTISDERTRTNALIETGRSYLRQDPAAAKAWLSNSGLNAAQQKRVTSGRRRRG